MHSRSSSLSDIAGFRRRMSLTHPKLNLEKDKETHGIAQLKTRLFETLFERDYIPAHN